MRVGARLRRLMAQMRFEKWQALGNDYLILERDELPFELTPARVRRLCEGHFGVFADGVLLLSRAERPRARGGPADLQPRRLGGRAVGQRRARGDPVPAPPRLDRPGRVLDPHRAGRDPPDDHRAGHLPVDMGTASLTLEGLPRRARRTGAGTVDLGRARLWSFQHVSIGNPQCAIHVDERARARRRSTCRRSARRSKAHEHFPNRTNVSWYTELDCGASPAAASARGSSSAGWGRRCPRAPARPAPRSPTARLCDATRRPARVTVVLDGGELEVEVGEDLHVNLTGWARPVFAGRLSEDFEKELHETE